MSATPATTAEGGRRWGSEFFAVLQRIGRSLMLPIAVLPAAALLLRLGQDDLLGPDGFGWIGRPRSSATPAEPCSTTCPCSSPSGSRPIITAFAALGLGVVFGIVWPPIGEALGNFAEWLYGLGPVGPGSAAPPTAPSSPPACITSIATGSLLIIPVGLAYAVLYYFLFRVLIRRFDLATPGRERTEEEAEEAGLITRST